MGKQSEQANIEKGRDAPPTWLRTPTQNARRYTHLDVGRNKPVRALSAGLAFPALRLPKTPTLADAGRSYSCLHPSPTNGLEQTRV